MERIGVGGFDAFVESLFGAGASAGLTLRRRRAVGDLFSGLYA